MSKVARIGVDIDGQNILLKYFKQFYYFWIDYLIQFMIWYAANSLYTADNMYLS